MAFKNPSLHVENTHLLFSFQSKASLISFRENLVSEKLRASKK